MVEIKTLAHSIVLLEHAVGSCNWAQTQIEQTLSSPSVFFYPFYDQTVLVAYLLAQQMLDDVEILQLSVHPQYLRQGIATKLLNQLLQDAKKKKTVRILLEVRVSNVAACALYQKVGFEIDGRRKNYYPTNTVLREDALLMSLTC